MRSGKIACVQLTAILCRLNDVEQKKFDVYFIIFHVFCSLVTKNDMILLKSLCTD